MMCFLWENMGFCVRKSAHVRMTLRLNWLSATGSYVKCSDCRCTEAVILSRELEFITSYLDIKLWAAQLLYGCDRSGGGIKANNKHLSPVSEALGFEVWNLGGNNPKWRCRALFWRNSGGFFKDQLLSVCSTCSSPPSTPHCSRVPADVLLLGMSLAWGGAGVGLRSVSFAVYPDTESLDWI